MSVDQNLPKDTRHLARLLAVQYLFSKVKASSISSDDQNFTNFEPQTILQSILEEKKFNRKLYESLVEGAESNLAEIDDLITKYAPEWPIDQINTVDLCILRISIWEAFIGKTTAPKIVINEAIELAKELSSAESASFINGVLGTILKTI